MSSSGLELPCAVLAHRSVQLSSSVHLRPYIFDSRVKWVPLIKIGMPVGIAANFRSLCWVTDHKHCLRAKLPLVHRTMLLCPICKCLHAQPSMQLHSNVVVRRHGYMAKLQPVDTADIRACTVARRNCRKSATMCRYVRVRQSLTCTLPSPCVSISPLRQVCLANCRR